MGTGLLGCGKLCLLDSAVVLSGGHVVVLEVTMLCLLLFANLWVACRAIPQFSEFSLLLQSLLVHLSLLASFLALDKLQRDDCVVQESE